jgi:hypothetical protein
LPKENLYFWQKLNSMNININQYSWSLAAFRQWWKAWSRTT